MILSVSWQLSLPNPRQPAEYLQELSFKLVCLSGRSLRTAIQA